MFNNLGSISHQDKKYQEAIEYYEQATLKVEEAAKIDVNAGYLLFEPYHLKEIFANMSASHSMLGNDEIALNLVRRSIMLQRKFFPEKVAELINKYKQISKYFLQANNVDSANYYARQMLFVSKGNSHSLAESYNFLGSFYH